MSWGVALRNGVAIGLGAVATLFSGTRDSGASVGNLLTEASDNLVQEDGGQLLLEGPPALIRHDPRVLDAYLGGGIEDLT